MHTLQQMPGMGKVQTEIELLTKQMLLGREGLRVPSFPHNQITGRSADSQTEGPRGDSLKDTAHTRHGAEQTGM